MRARHLRGFTFLLLAAAAVAQEPPSGFRPISELHHTAWSGEQGAPGDTYAIAQTPDGWLWLGGPNGLFRFDGVQFEPVTIKRPSPAQSMAVYTLLAEDSGDLWVGYIYGGLSRLGKASVQHYGASEGLPAGITIIGLSRDAQGVLWAATARRRLFRFDGARWHPVGAESGFSDAGASSMLLDEQGTLWIAGVENIFRIRKGQQRVERTNLKSDGNTGLLQSVDGRMWYNDVAGIHLLPDQVLGKSRPMNVNAWSGNNALFDRDGYVWTTESAIQRCLILKGATELLYQHSDGSHFTSKDGLTSDRTHSLLEDMEGNIWVATASGVDRFRFTNVHKVTAPQIGGDTGSGPVAIAAAPDGTVWIGENHGSLGPARPTDGLWLYDGQLTPIARSMIADITAAERDANGALWVGGSQGVFRQELGNQFRMLPALPAEARGREVHAIVVDAAGDPWVSVQTSLYRLRNGTWETNGNLTTLPSARANVLARDPTGRIWLGYIDGRIAVVRDDKASWYGAQDGLELGMITAIHIDRFAVVAGERAVSILVGGRFHTLKATEEPSALEGVAGVAQARNGDLWMNGARGAVRISARDLQDALRSKSYAVTPELFDIRDGFPGMSPRVQPLPTLIQGTDDRLWFSGTLGFGWLDPQRVRRNSIPPPVQIRSVISDGATYPNTDKVRVPQGTRNIQISYTALSLSRPERVRFRYRLEGYDQGWVDAGTRRTAFYTNLPPGDYRFRVTAANDSGVWNNAGTSVAITLTPTFIQTKLFLALCVLTGLAMIWGAYVLRINQVTARERGRLEERLSERERIARELHDTLLQGVQALILQFQAAVNRTAITGDARQTMDDALNRADELLGEGRDRVKDLRSATTAPAGLSRELLTAVEPMSGEYRTQLRVIENGTPRDLHPIVREEVVRIAIEATSNAFRHAEARAIEVEVSFGPRQFSIHVRDDGRGMEESIARGHRAGHFGLIGMRERAKRIRGQISIWSLPGVGTEVNVIVPASMAYVRHRRTWRKQKPSVAPPLT